LKFIESGKRGTVLMSLGTNMQSAMLGKERLENILKTFAAIPDYNFIWKFESEIKDLPIKPTKNVFISKFLPQNDILAHPQVKAFVTHSGLFGTQEATWHGKPMVGIPFFVDQKRTMQKLKKLGVAVEVDFRTFYVEAFTKAILTILEEPSYAENAMKISKLFQDKPQKPLEKALWWIEYVMRNPDAPQFTPTNLKIGWFAACSYDVLLTLIIAVHIIAFIIYKLYKSFKKLFSSSDKSKLKRN
jgi:glucuronosyltransferase